MRKIFGRTLVWLAGGTTGLWLGMTALDLNTPLAKAQSQAAPSCYRLTSSDTPFADDRAGARAEVWCYQDVERPAGAKYIFNVDDEGHTAPELSFLIEPNGTVTHFSMQKGERTVHRLQSSYLPLPVPVTPPEGAELVPQPISPSAAMASDETLEILTTTYPKIQDIAIRVGTFSSSLAPELLPWRGYWFPYSSGRMHRGADSAMAKFDKFAKARTGTNPGAQRWEATRHGYTGTPWEGHCNGWAAASILEKEPTAPWKDPFSGVEFSIGQLKGLMMEHDYCTTLAFFGHRYHGPGDNLSDMPAALFHNTIRYYLGELKKPILMDDMRTEPVENRVLSGYEMKVEKIGNNVYRVETTLMVHEYDKALTNDVGVAPAKPHKYLYKIWTDDAGNVKKGAWLNANPDFLWVPLARAKCKDKNQGLSDGLMDVIRNRPSGAVGHIW